MDGSGREAIDVMGLAPSHAADPPLPLTSAHNPDVDVIHRAMDVLHVQLVAREDGSHVHWLWDGHDDTLASRGWPTRDDAIAYMRTLLAYRGDDA